MNENEVLVLLLREEATANLERERERDTEEMCSYAAHCDVKEEPSEFLLLPRGQRFQNLPSGIPVRDADPSPPSSAELKNRVELYLYSP